jgi:23S rRNA (cytosine1962-C5)-methyltransferase
VREEAAGKRFLNLFSYTGSFTVYAAAGGARSTTSVDLSKGYLSWAQRNLKLNGFDSGAHHRVRADALSWMRRARSAGSQYDLIVLDPPPFSASKAMAGRFNVQRDHLRLLDDALALLAPEGSLYFSTSFLRFEPQWQVHDIAPVVELTPASMPEDFRRRQAHRCWRWRRVTADHHAG